MASIASSSKLTMEDALTPASHDAVSALPSLITPAELEGLLSLPRLEAIFFRSVATVRPVGLSKHWAVAAIAQHLNAAIFGLAQRQRRRQREDQTRRDRNSQRRKKRKAPRDGQGAAGDAKRYKTEGRGESEALDDERQNRDTSAAASDKTAGRSDPGDIDESDGEDSKEEADPTDDEDQEEQDEVARLQHRLDMAGVEGGGIGRGLRLEVTPGAILDKLAEYYDVDTLDDIDERSLTSHQLAPHPSVRHEGYSNGHTRPGNPKRPKREDEGSDEDDEDEPIDFVLVPGDAYMALVDKRAGADEEQAARDHEEWDDSLSSAISGDDEEDEEEEDADAKVKTEDDDEAEEDDDDNEEEEAEEDVSYEDEGKSRGKKSRSNASATKQRPPASAIRKQPQQRLSKGRQSASSRGGSSRALSAENEDEAEEGDDEGDEEQEGDEDMEEEEEPASGAEEADEGEEEENDEANSSRGKAVTSKRGGRGGAKASRGRGKPSSITSTRGKGKAAAAAQPRRTTRKR